MIHKLLIANRGEIAGRVISTARRLGLRTVAVYSEADRESVQVKMADEAVLLGGAAPAESYLNIEAILRAAERSGADAVHPGYGFLAENAEFAARVRQAGLTFVGPSAEAIRKMGSKVEARALCLEAGVPTVPGCPALCDEELLLKAEEIGYPVMLKASAGGGGKGMRRLTDRQDLEQALPSARREALKAFGSDEVYLEKALVKARHLEVQIAADERGGVVHLGVRECSLQRRHQKIVEESPPPNASPELLRGLAESAVRLAKAVNYSNVGTVEYLVDGEKFYFLEMNTRLQVEHPVTEMTTGVDLVELQLEIAEGKPLPFSQEQVRFGGHAVEARITCEEPWNNFLPATGRVLDWRPSDRARVDVCLSSGSEVTPHYDSMVAKVVCWGTDRARAMRSLNTALRETVLLGVGSNIDFLVWLLEQKEVRAGLQHTELVESLALEAPSPSRNQLLVAAVARALALTGEKASRLGSFPLEFSFEGHPPLRVEGDRIELEEKSYHVETERGAVVVDGHRFPARIASDKGLWWVHTPDGTACFREEERLPVPHSEGAGGSLSAPMPGSVVEILVAVGEQVHEGQVLLKMEAMKMEQTVVSPRDGEVEAVLCALGEQVEAGAALVALKSEEETQA